MAILRNFFRGSIFPVLIFLIIGLNIAFSNRNTELHGLNEVLDDGKSFVGGLILTVGSFILVAGAALRVFLRFIKDRLSKARVSSKFLKIIIFYFIYWFSQKVSPGSFDLSSFEYQSLYILFIPIAVGLCWNDNRSSLISVTRDFLFLLQLAGVAFFFINYSVVYQDNYESFFSFINGRYWGLTSHANNMGPQAVLLGVLCFFMPYRKRLLNIILILIVALELIFCQSKTTIISAAVSIFFVYWISAKINLNIRFKRKVFFAPKIILMFGCFFPFITSIIFIVYISALDLFTGRGSIWLISLNSFYSHPIFGSGNLWTPKFAEENGYLGVVSNAHNQWIDALTTGGVIGVASLVLFYFVLVNVISFRDRFDYLSAFLLLFIAFRGLTEVPLKMGVILTNDFGIFLFLFLFIVNSISSSIRIRRLS